MIIDRPDLKPVGWRHRRAFNRLADEPNDLFETDEEGTGVAYTNEAGDERVVIRDGRYIPQVSEDGYMWHDACCLRDDMSRQEAVDWVGP